MKALLAVFALVLAAVFIVRQPDAESSGTAGRGTGIDDGGPLGSRCTVFADVPTMRDGQLIGPGRFRCAKSNGGVDVTGLTGNITAETTNGGVVGREIAGAIDASTTNGGVDVELSKLAEGGAKLECTNGGIKLELPSDSKATISASITNGGIDASGLSIETTQSSRRRLEGKLNGGGAPIRIAGTNGGVRIAGR